jgi:glycine oxidase
MQSVLIVGGGIVGAMIAHELSLIAGLRITLFDHRGDRPNASQAALGVMMGAISQKQKGLAWERRRYSLARYDRLVEALELELGRELPYNREGLVMACLDGADWPRWQQLAAVRLAQGLPLELLQGQALTDRYPQFAAGLHGAIVSRCDRQVDAGELAAVLVRVAQSRGVDVIEERVRSIQDAGDAGVVATVDCGGRAVAYGGDWAIVAAGLGSAELSGDPGLMLRPVLGQGIEVRLGSPLGAGREPVLTGEDIHVVPVTHRQSGIGSSDSGLADSGHRYWVGATLELPDELGRAAIADEGRLAELWERAVGLWPGLAAGERVRHWSGLRPRPEGRPAPVIGRSGQLIVATGHYRNGVLLAPVTAREVIGLMGLELPIEMRLG